MAEITLPEVNFRVYIGPYHLDYDWSLLTYGAGFAPTGTTTTGQVSGATTMVVASAAPFGTAGGAWVGPNGSGQAWEYEKFPSRSGTTLAVVRESTTDREHNGVHSSGAAVYQFYPVTTNNGELTLTEECDETISTISWRASISGVLAPQHVLRNGHIVVVTTSTNGGSYTVELVGFVDSPTITDDSRSASEWQLNIVSSAQLVGEVEAVGVRVGDTDLADAGSATGVTELVLPFDERYNGDYSAAAPDLSPASAIDDDLTTLYLTERFVGADIWSSADNGDGENGDNLAFAHIYINPPPAAGPGARFIELRVRNNANITGFALNSANGGSGVEIWIFGGPGDIPAGSSIYLVEDEDAFTRLNPLAQSGTIYENRAFFSHILAAGGEFWLRLGALNSWRSRIRWGTGNGLINHPDAPSRSWSGPYVTAPSVGQTMRYIWTVSSGQPAARWATSMIRHTGYNIDNDDAESAYIMVSLPDMKLTLATDVTASSPGNGQNLYINGPDEKYSTDGLPSSGVLVIGDEEIAYSSSTLQYVTLAGSNARGANGTVAADHKAGDEILIKDGGVYTNAFLISYIGWQGAPSGIYPKHFTLYRTNLVDNVRTPDQDDWLDDWTGVVTLSSNTDSSHTAYGINARVRHLLYVFYEMTEDPARVRVAEINAILNTSTHNPDQFLPVDTTAGALIKQILENAGIPAGAITHSGTPALTEAVTADDNAWTVVSDIAEYAGCRVTVLRDSKFVIAVDTFWTGSPTVDTNWTRATASKIQKSFRKVAPLSQVILPWKTPDGSANGKVYYPETPGRGTKLEQQETLYNNSTAATASARRLYFMRLYPFEVQLTGVGNEQAKRAGSYHNTQWQFNDEMQPINRNYVVMSTEHSLSGGHWSSSFRLLQYGKESNL